MTNKQFDALKVGQNQIFESVPLYRLGDGGSDIGFEGTHLFQLFTIVRLAHVYYFDDLSVF